jgi:hypothetical protein
LLPNAIVTGRASATARGFLSLSLLGLPHCSKDLSFSGNGGAAGGKANERSLTSFVRACLLCRTGMPSALPCPRACVFAIAQKNVQVHCPAANARSTIPSVRQISSSLSRTITSATRVRTTQNTGPEPTGKTKRRTCCAQDKLTKEPNQAAKGAAKQRTRQTR